MILCFCLLFISGIEENNSNWFNYCALSKNKTKQQIKKQKQKQQKQKQKKKKNIVYHVKYQRLF